MAKLAKSTFPSGSTAEDFQCFGPVAVEDTKFTGFRMADLGCFQQEEKGITKDGDARKIDSNKSYHAAVVQHRKTKVWYLYVEYGRVGAGNPQYQFTECSSEYEAMAAFAKQCAEKNTKRGVTETVGGLKMFVPKKNSKGQMEDLYRVQRLVSRSFGLPDGRKITADAGTPVQVVKSKSVRQVDTPTAKLIRDLVGGAITYTRSAIKGGTIPTQQSLDEGRDLLAAARQRVAKVGNDVKAQIADKDLKQITYLLYSCIPKVKRLGAADEEWLLSEDNILQWDQDIDAFESALKGNVVEDASDPLDGFPIDMEAVPTSGELGRYITNWWTNAKSSSQFKELNILNLWKIHRHKESSVFKKKLDQVHDEMSKVVWTEERPLHQDKKRFDIESDDRKKYWESNTCLLMHGSRTVNVGGILRENFRLPSQLVGVTINAAMFGGGIYNADVWNKSANYCSTDRSAYGVGGGVQGRHAFMFACDVIVGVPHKAPDSYPFVKAPAGCHSVCGKQGFTKRADRYGGGKLANNEWIVYDSSQVLMKYLIEFKN